jgi:peptidoglycan/xylan/chitin deacetylase (PgdA/CDA1 family)
MNLREFWYPFRGACSLTFDDGTENQLMKAVPRLDERGLAATFYLNPGGRDWSKRLHAWGQVAVAGHEIGNHTCGHVCSNNIQNRSGGLEDITFEDIETDILTAQDRLCRLVPHQKHWSFAYPCYCTFVGKGERRKSYVPLVARHFLAARAGGEYGFANHPYYADLACLWSIAVERMSGYEMIGLVEELTFRGMWVILTFHEIDGERLSVGSYDFAMLLDYLQRKSEEIWVAPVIQVAGKILDQQN